MKEKKEEFTLLESQGFTEHHLFRTTGCVGCFNLYSKMEFLLLWELTKINECLKCTTTTQAYLHTATHVVLKVLRPSQFLFCNRRKQTPSGLNDRPGFWATNDPGGGNQSGFPSFAAQGFWIYKLPRACWQAVISSVGNQQFAGAARKWCPEQERRVQSSPPGSSVPWGPRGGASPLPLGQGERARELATQIEPVAQAGLGFCFQRGWDSWPPAGESDGKWLGLSAWWETLSQGHHWLQWHLVAWILRFFTLDFSPEAFRSLGSQGIDCPWSFVLVPGWSLP